MPETHIEVDYLESIIKPLLQEPDDLRVVRAPDEMGILLTIHVAQTDMGRMIGREGNTARSIRTLLKQFGMPHRMIINMKIAEPEGNSYQKTNNNDRNDNDNFNS